MKKLFKDKDYSAIISSLLAIVIGLVFGLIVLFIIKPNKALAGFELLITGGFYNGLMSFGSVFYYAAPLILCGLGTGLAFKASIFNIGGPGQMHVAAVACIMTAYNLELPGALGWIVPCLVAAVAGALWALIPAILNAYKKVNIIITTIMMNYIGMYLAVDVLRKSNAFDTIKNQAYAIPTANRIPRLGLDKIFRGSAIDSGFIIAVVIAIILYIVLEKTTFGYEIKACGKNRDASDYAGINAKKMIIISMLMSGALIGLAVAFMQLGWAGKHLTGTTEQITEGFTGIAVTLLANNNPIGTIFSGFFLAYLSASGSFMQAIGFSSEIVDVISSAIIYCSALSLLIGEYIRKKKLETAAKISGGNVKRLGGKQ